MEVPYLEPIESGFLVETECDGAFVQSSGPFESYMRVPGPNGSSITARLPKTGIGFLIKPLYRHLLKRPSSGLRKLLPPEPLSAGSLKTLGILFWVQVIVAYCGTLLGQTLAFAAPSLHASPEAQATALAVARVDVLIALPLGRAADRIGRVRLLLLALVTAVIFTSLGGLSPNIQLLTLAEIFAKAGATAATLIIAVVAAESVESHARAWSLGLFVVSTAIGTGTCAIAVSGLGLSRQAWRILFIAALLAIPLTVVARKLPEPARFKEHREPMALRQLANKSHRKRLILVCVAAALVNLFYIPQSQLRNQFLRFDRHMSAPQVSLFTLVTNGPGGIGLVIGSRLSEVKGRKPVAVFGLVVGALLTAFAFLSAGLPLYLLAAAGAAAGTAAVPALAVFGPELFPTRLRSGANSVITVLSRVGSISGLFFVGILAAKTSDFGTPIALLAIGPLLLSLIVWKYFPETKGQTLEQVNPEDSI
jgi:putative MFS transporter